MILILLRAADGDGFAPGVMLSIVQSNMLTPERRTAPGMFGELCLVVLVAWGMCERRTQVSPSPW